MCRHVGDRRAFWNRRDDWSGRRHCRAHVDVLVGYIRLGRTRFRNGRLERQVRRRHVPFLALEIDFGPIVARRIDMDRRSLRQLADDR